jgi:hypothetical protein
VLLQLQPVASVCCQQLCYPGVDVAQVLQQQVALAGLAGCKPCSQAGGDEGRQFQSSASDASEGWLLLPRTLCMAAALPNLGWQPSSPGWARERA